MIIFDYIDSLGFAPCCISRQVSMLTNVPAGHMVILDSEGRNDNDDNDTPYDSNTS